MRQANPQIRVNEPEQPLGQAAFKDCFQAFVHVVAGAEAIAVANQRPLALSSYRRGSR